MKKQMAVFLGILVLSGHALGQEQGFVKLKASGPPIRGLDDSFAKAHLDGIIQVLLKAKVLEGPAQYATDGSGRLIFFVTHPDWVQYIPYTIGGLAPLVMIREENYRRARGDQPRIEQEPTKNKEMIALFERAWRKTDDLAPNSFLATGPAFWGQPDEAERSYGGILRLFEDWPGYTFVVLGAVDPKDFPAEINERPVRIELLTALPNRTTVRDLVSPTPRSLINQALRTIARARTFALGRETDGILKRLSRIRGKGIK